MTKPETDTHLKASIIAGRANMENFWNLESI